MIVHTVLHAVSICEANYKTITVKNKSLSEMHLPVRSLGCTQITSFGLNEAVNNLSPARHNSDTTQPGCLHNFDKKYFKKLKRTARSGFILV